MRKKILQTVILFLITVVSNSQNNTVSQQQVDSAVKKITGEQYIRVPERDFETILENKIDEKVRSKVFFWVGLLVGAVTFIMVLLNYYITNKQKEQIQEYTKQQVLETQKELQALIGREFQQYFDAVEDKLKHLTDFLNIMWKESAYNLTDRTRNNKDVIDTEEAETFNSFLENKMFALKDKTQIKLIDAYVRCMYFSTKAFTDNERFSKMRELVNVYGQKLQLLPQTYAMAAIGFQDRYEQYNQADDRNKCVECCDEALKKLPDYGTPYAVKIEVFMIDYMKAFDVNEQNLAKNNLLRIFKLIENNSSTYLVPEITQRLQTDRASFMKKYIDELEKDFKPEITKLNIAL